MKSGSMKCRSLEPRRCCFKTVILYCTHEHLTSLTSVKRSINCFCFDERDGREPGPVGLNYATESRLDGIGWCAIGDIAYLLYSIYYGRLPGSEANLMHSRANPNWISSRYNTLDERYPCSRPIVCYNWNQEHNSARWRTSSRPAQPVPSSQRSLTIC